MPVPPLFIPDNATLRSKLRLTPLETGSDAETQLDDAITNARVGFLEALGFVRAAQIAAYTYTVTPSTQEEFLRLLAAQTEVKLVRLELTEAFRLAYMDASGDIMKRWNDEPMFREMTSDGLEKLIERLRNEIASAMAVLSGDSETASTINVWDGAPACPTPSLGDSLERRAEWAQLLNDPHQG